MWAEEIERAAATLDAIRTCVAPSPRRERWIARTEAAVLVMVRFYARHGEASPYIGPARRAGEGG